MKVVKLFAALVALCGMAYGQVSTPNPQSRVAGRFVAANYGRWTIPIYTAPNGLGSQTFTVTTATAFLSDGRAIMPFNTNAQIVVGSEVVAISSVGSGCVLGPVAPGVCQLTAAFTVPHTVSDKVSSATFGLQEAINDASASGGGAVVVDSSWAGIGGTTAMVNAAAILTNTGIEDVRTGPPPAPPGTGNTISTNLTNNQVPKATGPNNLGDSQYSDDGTNGAYNGTGGFNVPNGPITSGTPPASCGAGAHCIVFQQGTTACTPTSGEACITSDSTLNNFKFSLGTTSGTLPTLPSTGISDGTRANSGDYQYPEQIWRVEDFIPKVGTSACVISAVTYNTALTCAVATANAYLATNHIAPLVRMGWGNYTTDITLALSCYGNGSYQCVGLRGEGMWATHIKPLNGSVAVTTPMINVTGTSPNTSAISLGDFSLEPNYQFAGCMALDGVTINEGGRIVCQKSGASNGTQTGTTNTAQAYSLGMISGASGDNVLSHIWYINGVRHGTGAIFLATLSGGGTGTISSWTLQNEATVGTITAGTGGTPGTYHIAATGGTCQIEPNVAVTVGAGGGISSAVLSTNTANGWPAAGLCSSGTPTIDLTSTGVTGGSVPLVMVASGDANYNSAYNWNPIYSGPNRPGDGVVCTTMPTNKPVLTYSGGTSGSITAAGLLDGTVASIGAGCTGPVWLQFATGDPVDWAFRFNKTPDSHFYDFTASGGGQLGGFRNDSGGFTLDNLHVVGVPIGYDQSSGGNTTVTNFECDTVLSACAHVGNSTLNNYFETVVFNSGGAYPGVVNIAYGAGAASQQKSIGGMCNSMPYDASNFVNKATTAGDFFAAGVSTAYPRYTIMDDTCSTQSGGRNPFFLGHGTMLGGTQVVQITGLNASDGSPVTIPGFSSVSSGNYIVYTQVLNTASGEVGSTLPSCQVSWTDSSLGVTAFGNGTATSTNNTKGTSKSNVDYLTNVSGSTAIQRKCTGYVAGSGTALTYAIDFIIQGPF